MKMRMKMKNRLHKYDINRIRPRHGYKYTKYKIWAVNLFCKNAYIADVQLGSKYAFDMQ